jgi:hypothetical protein
MKWLRSKLKRIVMNLIKDDLDEQALHQASLHDLDVTEKRFEYELSELNDKVEGVLKENQL